MSKLFKALLPYEAILLGGFGFHSTYKYFADFSTYPIAWAWLGSLAFCISILLVVLGFALMIDIFTGHKHAKTAGKED